MLEKVDSYVPPWLEGSASLAYPGASQSKFLGKMRTKSTVRFSVDQSFTVSSLGSSARSSTSKNVSRQRAQRLRGQLERMMTSSTQDRTSIEHD
eukprot:gene342-287_t